MLKKTEPHDVFFFEYVIDKGFVKARGSNPNDVTCTLCNQGRKLRDKCGENRIINQLGPDNCEIKRHFKKYHMAIVTLHTLGR